MIESSMQVSRREVLSLAALSAGVFALPMNSALAKPRKLKNGIDISWLPDLEKAGGKFFTPEGKQIDPILLMKQAGISVGRIRVWVNPTTDGASLPKAIKLAKRLKARGLEICIDFHFSDIWADPSHQAIPKSWSTSSIEQLKLDLSAYVTDALGQFVAARVSPQWVQLGNEISNGFLWPLGKVDSESSAQWGNFVGLWDAAVRAMRATLPKAKAILHLDCGGDINKVSWWLRQANLYDLSDYDILGLSYYSQWQGPLSNLKSVLSQIALSTNKQVVIAETAYPWTTRAFGSDVIDISRAGLAGLPMTPIGQSAYIAKLTNLLRALPSHRGVGIWWWEGLAHQVRFAGGNIAWTGGMDNSLLVNPAGQALPGLVILGS